MPTVVDSRSSLATDPLRNFRFQVNIPHTTPSGQKLIQLGFMTMDGLNLETQVIAYREGGFNTTTQKMPGQTDFTPITMTTGVIVSRPHMWDWITEIFAVIAGTGPVSSNFRTNGQILVMSHPYTSNPVPAPLKMNVYNMWPSSFGISGLDAGGNAVLMEQIVLQNEGWQPYYSSAWNLDATAPSV